jgi:hypothetical protein
MPDIDLLPRVNTVDLENDGNVNHFGEVIQNMMTDPKGKMDEIIIPIGHGDGLRAQNKDN